MILETRSETVRVTLNTLNPNHEILNHIAAQVHKMILETRSETFRVMLNANMRESSECRYDIIDTQVGLKGGLLGTSLGYKRCARWLGTALAWTRP